MSNQAERDQAFAASMSPTPERTPDDHRPGALRQPNGLYLGVCTCGWQDHATGSALDAIAAANRHGAPAPLPPQ